MNVHKIDGGELQVTDKNTTPKRMLFGPGKNII